MYLPRGVLPEGHFVNYARIAHLGVAMLQNKEEDKSHQQWAALNKKFRYMYMYMYTCM